LTVLKDTVAYSVKLVLRDFLGTHWVLMEAQQCAQTVSAMATSIQAFQEVVTPPLEYA